MTYPNLEALVREFNTAYTQGADALQRFREKHGLVKPTEIAHGDYETRGVVELRKSGVHVYASHKDTDAWCLDYAFDDEAVEEWVNWPLLNRDELALYLGKPDAERAPLGPSVHQYLESGARPPLPERLAMHIIAGGEFHGHNVGFEWHIWNLICVPRYGWPALPIEQCYCTAAMAAAMSMPRSLEDVAIALRLQEQKDKAGSRVMMQLAKPRRVEADGTPVWWTDPAKHATLHSYCKQDVVVEREVEKKLRPLSPMERRVWLLDFKINQRGVRVDLPLVKAAQRVVKRATERLNFQMGKVTDGQVTACTQAGALVGWLGTLGVQTESIDKEAVLALLDRPELPPKARQAVLLRQEAAKASTAKLTAMQNSVSPDGRVRGMFLYHGAGTGRWCLAGGSLVRVKRVEVSGTRVREVRIENVENTDLVWDGREWVAHEGVVYSGIKEVIYHDGVWATAQHVVYLSDTESVTLGEAAEAGAHLWSGADGIDAGEPQTSSVSYTSHTYDIINAGPRNRFMANGRIVSNSGKSVQLQNLPRGTVDFDWQQQLVPSMYRGDLDTLGLICNSPMQAVSDLIRLMLVPNPGNEFLVADFSAIEARGLAFLAGEEKVLEVFRRGEDIYLATASGVYSRPITKADKQERQVGKCACIAEGQLVFTDHGHIPIEHILPNHRVWDGEEFVAHDGVVFQGVKPVIHYQGLTATADHLVWNDGTPGPLAFGKVRACGHNLQLSGPGDDGGMAPSGPFVPVYDILNAGPRHRFTVNGVLVHNCLALGYQGGVGAFQNMAKIYNVKMDGAFPTLWGNASQEDRDKAKNAYETRGKAKTAGKITEEAWLASELTKIAWRRDNPNIVQFWKDLENAAVGAVANPGVVTSAGKYIKFRKDGPFLWCRLPSGRALCYPFPKLVAMAWVELLDGTATTMSVEVLERASRVVGGLANLGVAKVKGEARPSLTFKFWEKGGWKTGHYYGGHGAENCLAGDTEVLTSGGWMPITKVTFLDAVWDGVEWVHHDGLVDKGVKNVGVYGGVRMTPDHLVLGLGGSRHSRAVLSENWYKAGHLRGFEPSDRTELVYDLLNAGPRSRFTVRPAGGGEPFIVHNCTQAACRDLLSEALLRLEDRGYPVVLHVHDEAGAEVPLGEHDLATFEAVMAEVPEWAPGFPIAAEGYRATRYHK